MEPQTPKPKSPELRSFGLQEFRALEVLPFWSLGLQAFRGSRVYDFGYIYIYTMYVYIYTTYIYIYIYVHIYIYIPSHKLLNL